MPSKSTISFFQGANNVSISGAADRTQASGCCRTFSCAPNVDLDENQNVGPNGNGHQNGNANASPTACPTTRSNININGVNVTVSATQGYDNDDRSVVETLSAAHPIHATQPTQRNSFNSPNSTQSSKTLPPSQRHQRQRFTPGPFILNPNPNPNQDLCPGSSQSYAPLVHPPPPPASRVRSTVTYDQTFMPQATTPQGVTPPGVSQAEIQGVSTVADMGVNGNADADMQRRNGNRNRNGIGLTDEHSVNSAQMCCKKPVLCGNGIRRGELGEGRNRSQFQSSPEVVRALRITVLSKSPSKGEPVPSI
ncbi:hypothetical protein CPB84DRAFT_1848918 [Gymnopilus junonius]|uniref:Uncharacterized protein n=1 Tax=Gymnopilus junonius TaxID=109634 RepID=A0A9P5NJB1_GYMJU|nr:hypothetical protein CPB84DRAFT_1848918 [Gymnopilus junonius]